MAADQRPHPAPASSPRSGDTAPPGEGASFNDATHPRVLLLMSPATYRAGAFLNAAERLGIEAIQGVDHPSGLPDLAGNLLGVDLNNPPVATGQVISFANSHQIDAILAVDDSATLVAATANAALGRPHNDPESALAARDKWVMRQAFARAGLPVPFFERFPVTIDPAEIAGQIPYPNVVKPLRLSGSRGVIRADDPDSFIAAWNRTRRLLIEDEGLDPEHTVILIESFIPGVEVALEGLLVDGELQVLALFDKPDPLDGPFFEETIYVTPSRLPEEVQERIARRTAEAAAAVGLRVGPVHAELRINDEDVWPIELAGRSIGGLCSSVLEFGAGMSLEELILRQAAGLPLDSTARNAAAAGVMMIPIPKAGMLRAVDGIEEASAVPGVTGIEISARLNYPIVPLPEGASYLGFIFARGDDPTSVEAAIRASHAKLNIRIDPMLAFARLG
jgi:biotin carboxylase